MKEIWNICFRIERMEKKKHVVSSIPVESFFGGNLQELGGSKDGCARCIQRRLQVCTDTQEGTRTEDATPIHRWRRWHRCSNEMALGHHGHHGHHHSTSTGPADHANHVSKFHISWFDDFFAMVYTANYLKPTVFRGFLAAPCSAVHLCIQRRLEVAVPVCTTILYLTTFLSVNAAHCSQSGQIQRLGDVTMRLLRHFVQKVKIVRVLKSIRINEHVWNINGQWFKRLEPHNIP